MKVKSGSILLALGVTTLSVDVLSSELAEQNNAQLQPQSAIKQELVNAKQAVVEAQTMAEKIIADAQLQANAIRKNAAVNDAPTDLTPVEIQSARVAVELSAGTIEEIANAIMPLGWRVLVDVKDVSLLRKRYQYVSTKSRDQALRDLLGPAGLKHQYFFDLTDAHGNSSPLLVISTR